MFKYYTKQTSYICKNLFFFLVSTRSCVHDASQGPRLTNVTQNVYHQRFLSPNFHGPFQSCIAQKTEREIAISRIFNNFKYGNIARMQSNDEGHVFAR